MDRWLAFYIDTHGQPRSVMISGAEIGTLPFGADEFALGLADYDGEPVTLIEMPGNPDFRPMVVDVTSDAEVQMDFVSLADVGVARCGDEG